MLLYDSTCVTCCCTTALVLHAANILLLIMNLLPSFTVAANFKVNVTSGNSSEVVYLRDQWYLSRQFIVSVLATLFILPMLMFKSIGALSYTRWAFSLQQCAH